MVCSSQYHVTSEMFVVPHEEMLILYAPLKGVVAQINEATAGLLRDLRAGVDMDLTDDDLAILRPLISVGVVNGPPDIKLVRPQREFAPIHVTLMMTDGCNLRCVYCYANGGDSPRPAVIPMNAARAGIDYVADNALRLGSPSFSIGFHGAGEPTTAWNEYTELVEYAHATAQRLGLTASCATCTNAILSERRAKWIAEHSIFSTASSGLKYGLGEGRALT